MTGYQLTMSSSNDATDLVRDNTADGKNATIPTLSNEAGATAASLTDNTWGYKKDSGNFIPYVSNTKLLENKYATNLDETTLSFASKINYNQAAGTYELGLVLTSVANPMMNYMQNLDPNLCTTTPMSVLDNRDMKEYTIARLADGQCWMTSNLNLAGGTTLNAADSDVPTDDYYTLPASSVTGFDDDTKAYVYNSDNETTDQADCTSSQACNSYYSWLVATAGGKNASGTAVTSDGYNAAYSICPKGWRLPTATTSNASATTSPNWKTGDFYKLATAYGANLASSYTQNSSVFYDNAGPDTDPNFLLVGYYLNNAFYDGETRSGYWSLSSNSSGNAYGLSFGSSDVYSARTMRRRDGLAVRCILNDTMQDFTAQDASGMAPGEVRTLRDTRDNQTYAVAKLADGEVWMLQNLRLGQFITPLSLTTADSDVQPTGFTLNGRRDNGKFPYDTIGNVAYQYNTSQYYCADYGCYYNWYTSTAAAGTQLITTAIDLEYSICPKGWTLPTRANFVALSAAYNDSAASLVVNPTSIKDNVNGTNLPGLTLAGDCTYSSGLADTGSKGYYWSRTGQSNQSAAYMSFTSSSVNPTDSRTKYGGRALRCLVKNP